MSTSISQPDRPAGRRGAFSTVTGLYPPVVVLLAALLLVRILTDDRSAPNSRHSGSLNLSAVIALILIALAAVMLRRRRRGAMAASLAGAWLCIWMAIAVHTSGASTETLREGVREASVLALAVIVYNARAITVPVAARLVQLIGCIPAAVALYQLSTHTGMLVAHNIRANGTFAHPNSAAMFFAIAAVASLWLYLKNGRRVADATLTALFSAALIATFSIDGLATLTAMLITLGTLRLGSLQAKLVPCAIAAAIVLVFFATPLGSKRVAGETATNLTAAERGETTSTLDTRLYRWKTLLPEWEDTHSRPRARRHDHRRGHPRQPTQRAAAPQRIHPLPRRDRGHRRRDPAGGARDPHPPARAHARRPERRRESEWRQPCARRGLRLPGQLARRQHPAQQPDLLRRSIDRRGGLEPGKTKRTTRASLPPQLRPVHAQRSPVGHRTAMLLIAHRGQSYSPGSSSSPLIASSISPLACR